MCLCDHPVNRAESNDSAWFCDGSQNHDTFTVKNATDVGGVFGVYAGGLCHSPSVLDQGDQWLQVGFRCFEDKLIFDHDRLCDPEISPTQPVGFANRNL